MDEEIKKKNVLDLQFQKYLVIASTSVIIAFTYAIGVGIAVFTKQIILDDVKVLDKPRTSVRWHFEHPKVPNKPRLMPR